MTSLPALVPGSSSELEDWIAADLAALGLGRWLFRYRVTNRIAYYQWLRRRAEFWRLGHPTPNTVTRLIGAVLAVRVRLLGERLGFSVPLGTTGPGLRLAHVGTVVVHVDSRLGARCTLHQGVTVGEADGRIATLGNDCHLAPNAVILGARLGDRVGVWANAVVTHDYGDDCAVAGVPARVVGPSAHALRSV